MSTSRFVIIAVVLCFSAATARELLAPVPAPAPSSKSYTVPNWVDEEKIANVTLPVGGTIYIPWKGRHGVYAVPSYACPTSFSPENAVGAIAGPSNGGSFNQTFTKAGTYYFACQVGDHCSEGQLIAVTVV